MINKNGGGDRRLIRNAGLLVELSFPTVGPLQGLRVGGVRHDYAAGDVSGVERLESGGCIHIGALIPELDPDLLAVDPQNLEREVSVGAQSRKLGCLFFLVVLLFVVRSGIRYVGRMVVRR